MDIRKSFDGKKNKICKSLKEHNDRLEGIKAERKKEIKNVVLTNKALELHDSLERTMKDLARLYKKYRKSFPDKELPILSLKTLLPDLVVAAVLWCKEDELIDGTKSVMESLMRLVECSKEKPDKIAETHLTTFDAEFDCLKKRIEKMKPEVPDSELQKNHDFLSQQIDARSSQIFSMGPLFVPISFLIFVYAVNSIDGHYLGGVPLMFASLSCYLVWFIMYLRIGKLNNLSYPLIHSLELMLGLSTHSSLFQIREKHWIVRIRQHVFYTAFYMLITLWVLFFIRPEEIWKPPPAEFWNPTVHLAIGSISVALVLSLLWEPSPAKKRLVVLSALTDLWTSILLIRLHPSFLAILQQFGIELLTWISLIGVGWFAVWFGITRLNKIAGMIRAATRKLHRSAHVPSPP